MEGDGASIELDNKTQAVKVMGSRTDGRKAAILFIEAENERITVCDASTRVVLGVLSLEPRSYSQGHSRKHRLPSRPPQDSSELTLSGSKRCAGSKKLLAIITGAGHNAMLCSPDMLRPPVLSLPCGRS